MAKRKLSHATGQTTEPPPLRYKPRELKHYWRCWDIANRSETKAWRQPTPALAWIALKHRLRADRALAAARA